MLSHVNLKGTHIKEIKKIDNIENSDCEYFEIEFDKENVDGDFDISVKFVNEIYKRLWLDMQLKLTTHFIKMKLPITYLEFVTGSQLYNLIECKEEYKDLIMLKNDLEDDEYYFYDHDSIKVVLEYGQTRETVKEDKIIYRIPYKLSVQNTLLPNIIRVRSKENTSIDTL